MYVIVKSSASEEVESVKVLQRDDNNFIENTSVPWIGKKKEKEKQLVSGYNHVQVLNNLKNMIAKYII